MEMREKKIKKSRGEKGGGVGEKDEGRKKRERNKMGARAER